MLTPTPDVWDIVTSVDLMTPIRQYPAGSAWAYIALAVLLIVLVVALASARRAKRG